MESLNNYYQILELTPGSNREEIKQAYRKLAQKWHPDKFLNQPEQLKTAREKFEQIKAAYDHLLAFTAPAFTAPAANPPRPAHKHNSGPSGPGQFAKAEAHYQAGIAYAKAGNRQPAVESFTQAIHHQPDHLKAYQARAFILKQLGLHRRAETDFARVTELQQQAPSAPSQKDNAAKVLAEADIAFQQGLVQFKARNYGAAIETLSRAIRINPHHKAAYHYRSQAYFRRGYDDLAKADCQRMRDLEQPVTASAPRTSTPQSTSRSYGRSSHQSSDQSSGESSGQKTHQKTHWHCIHTLGRHTAPVSAVAITRDRKTLITGSYDKTLRIWSVKTGKLLKTLSDHTKEIHCVAISWDGKLVASGGVDQTIKIWEIRTGALIRSWGNVFSGHSDTVTALAFSPNNQSLVSTSLDQTVRLWSLKSGQETYALKDYGDSIFTVAMGSEGKAYVVGGKGNGLSMHHTKTGKLLRSFAMDGQTSRAVALSRQGSLLASTRGAEIWMWNRHYQKKLLQLKGHGKSVSSLAFRADGRVLVSGSDDQTIRLWNAHTGEPMDTLPGHQSAVHAVAYSLDGQVIVSGSGDQTVRIWQQN